MNSHINKVCNASFYYLYNIRQIRKHLSHDSSETSIHAFVSSRLDYCNSLLYGLPQVQIDKIQRVQNAAARLIFKQPKFCNVIPVLFTAWRQIIFANWSAEGNQQDIPSDPAKKICLRFRAARYSQHLVVEHSVMRPQNSGTTYLVKYSALTLSNFQCHVKTYLFKQAFSLQ